jgi:hypothetical protein
MVHAPDMNSIQNIPSVEDDVEPGFHKVVWMIAIEAIVIEDRYLRQQYIEFQRLSPIIHPEPILRYNVT